VIPSSGLEVSSDGDSTPVLIERFEYVVKKSVAHPFNLVWIHSLMLQKSTMGTGAKEIENHVLVRPAPLQDPVRQH
jgi:hypothetical protein